MKTRYADETGIDRSGGTNKTHINDSNCNNRCTSTIVIWSRQFNINFKGMAATVIGGLISSTLLTLFVVPVMYEILFTLKNKLTKNLICKKT